MTTAGVLIVEDERVIAQAFRRLVTRLGHRVVGVAASGEEAIAQAAALRPDVVLMDIGLPGAMNGIDAARHIRARAPIPVIYVSAATDASTVARARQSTPAGYLVKPVSDRALRATLARVLRDPSRPGKACASHGDSGDEGKAEGPDGDDAPTEPPASVVAECGPAPPTRRAEIP
jgi:CheY-like chemotaxis protein